MSHDHIKRALATQMLDALDRGVSVEDILAALEIAVAQRLRWSHLARPAAYRRELAIFYRETLAVLHLAKSHIEEAGHLARRMTR